MKHFLHQPFTKLLALTIILVIGIFAAPQSAHAACSINPVTFSLWSCAAASIGSGLYFILAFVAWAIAAVSEGLNAVLHFQLDANLFVIVDLWKIVRDFANMLFILIFIIMALSTVFDIGSLGIPGLGGGTDVKALIAKFVVAALLINFSLVIGGLIIDAANVVNDVFLAAIGDFSTRIGSALNPSATLLNITPQQLQQLNINVSNTPADPGLAHIIKMFTSIIMGMIILFSILTALVFALFRIPFLAMLLVFSPIAWICGILPSTQSVNKSWWNQFIGWNIFLPVFLFFLYFGLYFISFQDQVLGSAAENFNSLALTGGLTGGFSGLNISLQTIFYYFIVAFTLIGGTKVALSAASGGGEWLTKTVSASKNAVWGLPGFSQFRAAGQASRIELEQIQKEGLGSQRIFGKPLGRFGDFIYGGEAGREKMVQRERSQLFGNKIAGLKPSSDMVGTVDKRLKDLKTLETAGKLVVNKKFESDTYALSPLSTEGIARRAVLYERGMINPVEFGKDMEIWTAKNPFLAEAMSEKAAKGKYRNVKGDQLLAMASGEGEYENFKTRAGATTTRRIWFNAIKDNDDALKAIAVPQLNEAVSILGGDSSNESKEFVKAVGNKRPDIIAQYKGKGNKLGTLREAVKAVKDKKASDLADVLEPAWDNPLFLNALRVKRSILNKKQPAVPGGVYIPAGTVPPATALTPGATWPPPTPGIPTTGGTIYPFSLFNPKEINSIPGAFKAKSQEGGGDRFKNDLLKQVGNSPKKLKAAMSI